MYLYDFGPGNRGGSNSYESIHVKMRKLRGPARRYPCSTCGLPARQWAYDHSDPDEWVDHHGRTHSLDISRYMPLCDQCHRQFDGPWSKSELERAAALRRQGSWPPEEMVNAARQLGRWPPPPRPIWPNLYQKPTLALSFIPPYGPIPAGYRRWREGALRWQASGHV